MTDAVDESLYERTKALLEPGEIELVGLIVHTDLASDEDLEMQELTVELNDVIGAHVAAGESYIYAGNDDPEFASNQFQGLTLADDEFVWECQQLLRDGTFDLVFYYEATADHEDIAGAVRALDRVERVTTVP
jgi:sugar phosphate isomerase/epimerase